jgi:hypothetical protein
MKNPCAGCPNVKAGCKTRSQCADFQAYENHMLNTEYPAHAIRRMLQNDIAHRDFGRSATYRRLHA